MIEQRLADFVHASPFFVLGTRDAKLRPHGTHVFGARMDPAARLLTVFVPQVLGGLVLPDLEATKVATVTTGEPVRSETYQFKGSVTDIRPMTDADFAVQEIYFAKFTAAVKMMQLPLEQWEVPPARPGIAVTIRVTDIFVQTPGPGAGARIGPEPG